MPQQMLNKLKVKDYMVINEISMVAPFGTPCQAGEPQTEARPGRGLQAAAASGVGRRL